ncbi:tetratricopeptide repeat protein, partial [Neoroseomonas soli]
AGVAAAPPVAGGQGAQGPAITRAGAEAPAPLALPAGGVAQQVLASYRASPALNEIADWLTKIIVGIGLVQARDIAGYFRRLLDYLLTTAGLERFPVAEAIVPAALIAGLIAGFFWAYLLVALLLSRELADAAMDLEGAGVRRAEEQARKAKREADKARKETEAANAFATREAALSDAVGLLRNQDVATLLRDAALDGGRVTAPPELREALDLLSNEDLAGQRTADAVRAWANAHARLGEFGKAIEAFRRLTAERPNAYSFSDLARVLEAAGRRDEARAARERAGSTAVTTMLDVAPRTLDANRILDLLYSQPPQPDEALEAIRRLENENAATRSDATVQMYKACALGQKHRQLKAQEAPDPDALRAVEDEAYAALAASLRGGMSRGWLQLLMDPAHPRKADVPPERREDDLETFNGIERFRQLLAPWPAG